MREPPSIPEEQLRACLQQHYSLTPVTLEFLPLGLDYNAGVYRVVSEEGTPYFLKVKSGSLYEPSCLVPHYLNDQGITAVVAPTPTNKGALWTKLENWTVIIYPFLDGDDVMLAPKERDFLFVKESSSESALLPGTPAFFQGYGQTDIDWIALTYYRYERVVQDLIACAQEVFFRDDLGEGTKADSVQLFQAILAEGGEIDAASQASAHLPPDLALPTKMVSGIEKELAGREQHNAL